jgi:hypothetical protein
VNSQPTTGQKRRRIIVVSGYGNDALTPRGQRTQRVIQELEGDWDVELIAMEEKPSSASPGGSTQRRDAVRRCGSRLLFKVLLDRSEPWALRRLGRWRPDADAALLIAAPWSPAVYASRRLAKAGIPYVVDVGDPWVSTSQPGLISAPRKRALRGERFLWEHAAGAVVTTGAQRNALQELFPDLSILVRPNGYKPISTSPRPRGLRARHDSQLRLAHFGILSAKRIDPVPFLAELQRSRRWESIVFAQFGDDFGIGLERVPPGVLIEHHDPRPWNEIAECAVDFDAALVVAYPATGLLPSKSLEYSTLSVPRIALTNSDPSDALREYVRNHSGWLAVSNGQPDIGQLVWGHLDREWSSEDLAPVAEDAWPAVAAQIVKFVDSCVEGSSTQAER